MSVVRRLVTAGAALMLAAGVSTVPAAVPASAGPTLAAQIDVPARVKQLVTVTNGGWAGTEADLRLWERADGTWRLVRGPIRASLGWNGFVKARERRQSSGTTPAGRFAMRSAFGTRSDPGSLLPYRRVDGNDFWPYEPRDPATYNILQPSKAPTTRWRSDYVERLADYGYEYAYSIVVDFNLPRGVRWSERRGQYVADRPADTTRGGGIFLHVRENRYTAGCVSIPIRQLRWLVRRLDPRLGPMIVMGPRDWVVRRF